MRLRSVISLNRKLCFTYFRCHDPMYDDINDKSRCFVVKTR